MSSAGGPSGPRGVIAWMVDNRVTPNLLMLFLLLGGLFMATRIKQEVFPEFELDLVRVRVPYPGASPEEVEQGIVLAVEEAIRGIDGIEEITASAGEGSASVTAELLEDADRQQVYQDIRQEVDRIATFPDDAEDPQVTLVARRRQVLDLQIYGDVPERSLRELAEQVRDRLLLDPGITQVDLVGARDAEIQVEVPLAQLRAHGLTLDQIAGRIGTASVEAGGGKVRTAGGEILLRVRDRRDWAGEFAELPLVTTPGGVVVTLGDIATVREGFEDADRFGYYNGVRSIGLDVYRVGSQTPLGVSAAVRAAMVQIEPDLPPGVDWAINRDRSEVYQQRLQLLLKNAAIGLGLVLLLLGTFLELKLAFWVTMGIPISFLGGLLFLPALGVSINLISMFAFIVALGIVVDDAIVAGENIYDYRSAGKGFPWAATAGARDVAVPISFSILTNVVAFLPIYFVPGTLGKVWKVIPVVVITVFLISWVESLLILPAHLAHARPEPANRFTAGLHRGRERFNGLVLRAITGIYGPVLAWCLRWRFVVLAAGIAVFTATAGYVWSGRIGMILMPRVESDRAVVTATLPLGSPLARAEEVAAHLVAAAQRVAAAHGGDRLVAGILTEIDENEVEVTAYLTDPAVRPLSTGRVTRLWREEVGVLPGVQAGRFQADRGGPGSGSALRVELSHRDIGVLDRAGTELAERLAEFPNVTDIDDGYTPGKEQLTFRLLPEGHSLGLTPREVARQVRSAFFGTTALRQQRGRNEVAVRVRLPEAERDSEYGVEELLLATPAGTFVPLGQAAATERGRAYTSISRRDGRRTVTVTADVEPIGEVSMVRTVLDRSILPQLALDHPGLSYRYVGRQASMTESIQSLLKGFGLAMLAIYFLLAIPFRSYTQPLIVMTAIPFGMAGAVYGHLLMGYNLSLMSMMGVVALSGVVVNDSLVLIDYANRQRRGGASDVEAAYMAGLRRFRPVILTTLTTFGGLAPMIFETSRQARFMIPMALSLGYGILFATLVTLVFVPCLYVIVEDVLDLMRGSQPTGGGVATAAATSR